MRGKERLGPAGGVDVFDHRPRDGETVIGRGAAANFIQQDQRARRGRIEDRRRLGHFHHESGAAARQIVAGADAGKDAVHHRQPRRTRRNKAAHLRHQHRERGLPQIR